MPYTTNVAGTTITAAWGNANVRDQVVTPFATAAARTSAITSPIQGMLSHRADLGSTGNLERYSGSAWVPDAAQLITANTLGSAVSTVTFSSIPSSYNSLMVMILGSLSGTGSSVDCTLIVNSDSGANYSNSSIDTVQSSLNPTGAFNSGQTSAVWGIALPGSSYNSSRSGAVIINIPGYSNTTFRKIGMTDVYMTDGGVNFNQKKRFWWWNSASAITTLLFTSGSGNFSTGSHFALYGMP